MYFELYTQHNVEVNWAPRCHLSEEKWPDNRHDDSARAADQIKYDALEFKHYQLSK